jgi:hypothetical protein
VKLVGRGMRLVGWTCEWCEVEFRESMIELLGFAGICIEGTIVVRTIWKLPTSLYGLQLCKCANLKVYVSSRITVSRAEELHLGVLITEKTIAAADYELLLCG